MAPHTLFQQIPNVLRGSCCGNHFLVTIASGKCSAISTSPWLPVPPSLCLLCSASFLRDVPITFGRGRFRRGIQLYRDSVARGKRQNSFYQRHWFAHRTKQQVTLQRRTRKASWDNPARQ